MAFLDLDKNYITEEVIETLASQTNVTYLSPGSKARLLLDIVNDKLGLQALQFDENIGKAFIRNATGTLLDFIGEIFGVSRELKEKAEISEEEKNLFFYTLENSFGEINNFEDIIIPAGTLKVYNTKDPSLNQIIYINSRQIILPANENSVYFSAEAQGFGSEYNTGANTMVYHDFKNYADVLNQTLLVNNDISMTYGKNDETDDNYRFRIQQQTIAGEAANFSAIRLNLLSIAGVSDVVRIKFPKGIGTAHWLIKAVTPEVPPRLLTLAQEAIDEKQGEGLENIATAPITIGIQLIFSITYRERLEDKIKELIRSTIKRDLITYINNLDIEEDLIIDQMVKIILNSDDRISSMGLPNSQSNFERINIYKRSALSNTKVRRSIYKDYSTREDERIIIEPTIIDPIIINDNN